VDERSTRVARLLEWPLLAAAVLAVPVIVIEQSNASRALKDAAGVANWAIWIAFASEVVVMLAVVPNRARWLRDHPLELAIVVLTPPFLPAGLQGARVFRLLRLLRLVKLTQLTRRIFSLEGLRDAAVLGLVTILGGGAAFAAVEKGQDLSTWDGIWWAVSTATTVGYGDVRPHTDAGRAIAIAVMVVGIGLLALLTAAAAERFIAREVKEAEEDAVEEVVAQLALPEREVLRRLDEIAARLERLEAGSH
jgi:voltage-gated potassium channel